MLTILKVIQFLKLLYMCININDTHDFGLKSKRNCDKNMTEEQACSMGMFMSGPGHNPPLDKHPGLNRPCSDIL
jgi:hypothetical protein